MIHLRAATEWQAPATLATAGHPMPAGPKRLVVLHHTFRPHRPCGSALSQERADLRSIDRFHREQEWAGIGYHYAGFQSGNVYQCRPITRTGAHTVGQNSKSVGYVFVIDGDIHEPTDAALESFRDWVRWAVEGNCITPDYTVSPHSAFARKTCPGSRVLAQLSRLALVHDRPLLMVGDRGVLVKDLQEKLMAAGMLGRGFATGYFGTRTLEAVRTLQREHRLIVDGVAGPQVYRALGM